MASEEAAPMRSVKFKTSEATLILTDMDWWPDLAQYLTAYQPHARPEGDDVRPIHIDIKCSICRGELALPAWAKNPRLVKCKTTDPEKAAETIVVLPGCGHLLGDECFKAWRLSCLGKGGPVTCPICRFEFRYKICQHEIPPRRLGLETSFSRVEDLVPKTQMWRLSEHGDPEPVGRAEGGNDFQREWLLLDARKRVPDSCAACRAGLPKSFMKSLFEHMFWAEDNDEAKDMVDNMRGGAIEENVALVEMLGQAESLFLSMFAVVEQKSNSW
jgi:hypothetical protein